MADGSIPHWERSTMLSRTALANCLQTWPVSFELSQACLKTNQIISSCWKWKAVIIHNWASEIFSLLWFPWLVLEVHLVTYFGKQRTILCSFWNKLHSTFDSFFFHSPCFDILKLAHHDYTLYCFFLMFCCLRFLSGPVTSPDKKVKDSDME